MFKDGFSTETVPAAITKLMEQLGLDPEANPAACIDAVEVGWWSHEEGCGAVAVLKQLEAMCEDETETDPDSGEVTVTAPKKIKALGVYDFPAQCAALGCAVSQSCGEGVASETRNRLTTKGFDQKHATVGH